MGRFERYRQKRRLKQKYFFSVILFLFLLVSGLFIADYTTNKLISDVGELKIVHIKNLGHCIEINFMNNKFYINTSYINRDINKIKNLLFAASEGK